MHQKMQALLSLSYHLQLDASNAVLLYLSLWNFQVSMCIGRLIDKAILNKWCRRFSFKFTWPSS